MREQFRDVSPEDADLQPIIAGLFGEYAARYGDYFSKDAEVELTEWYRRRRGCLSFWSAMARSSPPGRISPSTNIPQRSNVSGRIKRCASRAGRARGTGAGAPGGAGGLQPHLPDHGVSSAGGGAALSQPGYQPQFDLNRDPEEYSQPPFDGRLRFTKTLIREALSKTA